QIYYRVDSAAGITGPRHSARQTVAGKLIDYPSVAASDKAPPNMAVGYVEKVASANVGRGDFQHAAVPEDSTAHFGVEIIPETQGGGSSWNGNDKIVDAAARPIVIGEEKVIGR